MSISLRNITQRFGAFTALEDVSLDIADGELVALLGPSGSGKTSLLRIIAGLDVPDQGEVTIDGETVSPKSRVGFVFQHYALFKHMTVFENVAFGLRVRPRHQRPSEEQIEKTVMQLLSLVHLAGMAERYPSQLSGGQRQRVALARALAVEPSVLLLDEPFGALDAKVRKELRRFLRALHEELHITSVFVTHDQEEALEVADRVVVMSQGKIEQMGRPEKIYAEPKNAFVYDFLGNYNAFAGYRDSAGQVHLKDGEAAAPAPLQEVKKDDTMLEKIPGGRLLKRALTGVGLMPPAPPPPKLLEAPKGPVEKLQLFCRPHELVISRTPMVEEAVRARVLHINRAGPMAKLELTRPNGQVLEAELAGRELEALQLKKGDTVFARPTNVKLFE